MIEITSRPSRPIYVGTPVRHACRRAFGSARWAAGVRNGKTKNGKESSMKRMTLFSIGSGSLGLLSLLAFLIVGAADAHAGSRKNFTLEVAQDGPHPPSTRRTSPGRPLYVALQA